MFTWAILIVVFWSGRNRGASNHALGEERFSLKAANNFSEKFMVFENNGFKCFVSGAVIL